MVNAALGRVILYETQLGGGKEGKRNGDNDGGKASRHPAIAHLIASAVQNQVDSEESRGQQQAKQ